MRTEEVIVRALLGVMLLFVVIVVMATLADNGIAPDIILIWMFAIILFGVALGGIMQFIPAQWATTSGLLALTLAGLALILQYHVIPICGDGVCSPSECGECSDDCTASLCQNGRCDLTIERCDTSIDCACSSGNACSPRRKNTTIDERGCAPIRCGDNICDNGESYDNCCVDCGCKTGFLCENNMCFFQPPSVGFTPYILASRIGATSLACNPALISDDGVTHPLVGIEMHTEGTAYDVNITFRIDQLFHNTFFAGVMSGNRTALWYLEPNETRPLLRLSHDLHTNLTVTIIYFDEQKDIHILNRSFPFIIRERNTLDQYGTPVMFVTNDITTLAKTPQGIWDELRTRLRLTQSNQTPAIDASGSPHIQFPLQTLRSGEGTSSDIAMLLASAYDAAGLEPSIVEGPFGFFVRVRTKDRFVILDTTRIDKPFEQAINPLPGYAVYDVRLTREKYNLSVASLSESMIDDIVVTTTLDQTCDHGTKAIAQHTITNNGPIAKTLCATSYIQPLSFDAAFDQKQACYTIPAGESILMSHGWRSDTCKEVRASVTVG